MKHVSTFALILALTIAVASVFGARHVNEDLWMSLCSGRDTANGLLAQPDRWSFATEGKVWVDQGWLSGLVYYSAYKHFGESGLLAIKGILLVSCVAVLFFKCRRLNVSLHSCLTALTLGLLGIAFHLSLIAENFALLYFLLLTSLLTMDASSGPPRYLACILVMLAWSNSHGSFLIGYVLIWVKVFAQLILALFNVRSLQYPPQSHETAGLDSSAAIAEGSVENRGKYCEAWGWMLTGFVCLPVMAYLNPYGLENLYMPFRQAGSAVWTKDVIFWYPLLRFTAHGKLALYAGIKSVPFLIYILVVMIVGALTVYIVGLNNTAKFLRDRLEKTNEDLLTEILICISMLGLTFFFGRSLLFAGLAFVPITAFTIDACSAALEDRTGAAASSTLYRLIPLGLACSILAGTASFFYFQTLPPYYPENPLMNRASAAQKLLGPFSTNLDGLTSFLSRNKITGKVCSSWIVADVLLWRLPDIEVFLDLRAQSIYSDELRTRYKSVFSVDPNSEASVREALNILDGYGVDSVVLDKFLEPTRLPRVLSASRKWAPVYHDAYAIVYVRAESEYVSRLLESNGALWYPDPLVEVSSIATLCLERGIQMSPAFGHRLREVAVQSPAPLIYRAICMSERKGRKCLDASTRSFLWSEYARLGDLNIMRPGGYSILECKMQILSELDKDGERCPEIRDSRDYKTLEERLVSTMTELRRSYSPWTEW